MTCAASVIPLAATVTYTESATASCAASERPRSPILAITPCTRTVRKLQLVWGHPATSEAEDSVHVMEGTARGLAVRESFADESDHILLVAGLPFGKSGSTYLILITKIRADSH
ncbi:MAG: pyruvate kinase alpha/beta domain-containing protein [Candidatus Thiodiazotropha sp.]